MRPVIVYLFTTFPKSTELFMQREITSLRARGENLRIYSLWGGGGEFEGVRVVNFTKWRLVTLCWLFPWHTLRRPRAFAELVRGLFTRRPPSWLNFWENMLGAAFATVYAGKIGRERPALVHAAWGGAPATAAWLLWRCYGHRFSAACHAYDVYQDGGDWWLCEKLAAARFVHTSTAMVKKTLIVRGLPPDNIHAILSGLSTLPTFKPLRAPRPVLRLLCVARLVPKKGLDHQLRIYAALKAAGVPFEARIAGEGNLLATLKALARKLGVSDEVTFLGHRPPTEIAGHFAWADAMLHTGVVAPDGDRDGLPNVIPEAMAAGVLVLTSPVAGTTEAITDGVTGRVLLPEEPGRWVETLVELRDNDALMDRLRTTARVWVEEKFDAHKNSMQLARLFNEAAGL
ncbi:MAG: glycosyltransferase [Opitutaceae bacterium]|jgi:glycosyltransferase involved in cell wall biosynthesis